MSAHLLARLRAHAAMPSVLLFFGLVFLVSQLSIMVVLEPVGFVHFVQMQTTLSSARFEALVADMYQRGADGAYVAHFYYDWLHPLWYGGLLAALMARGFERHAVPAARNGLLLLPFVAGLADLAENALHLYMVVDTVHITPSRVALANGAALLKWALVAACVTLAAGLLLRPVRR